MDNSVRTCEPVEGVSAPKPDATLTGAEAEHLVEALGLANSPRAKTEDERLKDTLERIVEGYHERSGRVIVENPIVEAPVPHDLDSIVARLLAKDMRKLRLAEAMAGGPLVVGRFENGSLGLRQAHNRLTRVVYTDDTRTTTRIIPPTGSIPLGAGLIDREDALKAVYNAGYEVAPVEGDPFSYSYDKPPRVVAFEEAFGRDYVEGTEAAMLGPVECVIERVVSYFPDTERTEVSAGFSLRGKIWDRGVMLWLRV